MKDKQMNEQANARCSFFLWLYLALQYLFAKNDPIFF